MHTVTARQVRTKPRVFTVTPGNVAIVAPLQMSRQIGEFAGCACECQSHRGPESRLRLRDDEVARSQSRVVDAVRRCWFWRGSRVIPPGHPVWTGVPVLRVRHWCKSNWSGSCGPRFKLQKFEMCPDWGAGNPFLFFLDIQAVPSLDSNRPCDNFIVSSMALGLSPRGILE